jgi:hypothetical protein
MALKTLSAIALLLATTTANALTIDPQAPCASPAPDPYGALLNVRSGPGSQFPIVNQLRPGDIVAMLPELSGNWQHIAVYEGDGWAFRLYLQVVACPPPPPALDAPASPVAPPEGIQSAPLEDIPPLALPFAPVLPPAYAYAPPRPSGPVLPPADWYRPWHPLSPPHYVPPPYYRRPAGYPARFGFGAFGHALAQGPRPMPFAGRPGWHR